MSKWQQWFKGFLNNWFNALADSLSSLDDTRRKLFEESLGSFTSLEIVDFSDAWDDLETPDSIKQKVTAALDAFEEPSKEQMGALKEWFTVLINTIEEQPQEIREKLLSVCGSACAGHAIDAFKKVYSESNNLEEYLQNLNTKLCKGEDVYRYVSENTIEVAYPRCFCPIVGFKLITSPILCNCSSSWLKTNLEATLDKTVEVRKISTALSGNSTCSFKIKLS
jgi:predicted hydrocarbon binding protein